MDKEAQVNVIEEETQTTVVGQGALDLGNSMRFELELKSNAETAQDLVVDLRQVTFIDTAVLTYLVSAARTLIARGKRLKVIAAINSHPLRTLTIVGFQSIMDIVAQPAE